MPKEPNEQSRAQIFKDSFEASWKEFDDKFRKLLLKRIQELGSLYRLQLTPEEANREFGSRFYEALESTLTNGKYVDKWKKALTVGMPKAFGQMADVFGGHELYPFHAFFLLLIYIHEYPLRAFFSGRDRQLPFNTLTLRFEQTFGDRLPTGVRYELEMINLGHCPGLTYDRRMAIADTYQSDISGTAPARPNHPRNHWWDLIWIWHFDWPLGFTQV